MSVTLTYVSTSVVLPDPELLNEDQLTPKMNFFKSRLGDIRTTIQTDVKRTLVFRFILTYSLMNNLAWFLNAIRSLNGFSEFEVLTMTGYNSETWLINITNNPLTDQSINNDEYEVILELVGYTT